MAALSAALQTFATASSSIFAEAKVKAMALPANTVQVWPGGTTFTTIQAAINSITNASPQLQYQVAVGPGTYQEQVTMIDNIYVIGAGQDVTIITAQNGAGQSFNGVVNSSSNAGLSEVTLNAQSGGWGTWPVGVKITGSGNFHISGVTINAADANAVGNNVRCITNNTGSYAGSIIVGQSILNGNGGDSSTVSCIELFGMSGLTMLINLTAIQAQSQAQTFGITTAVNATVTVEDSKIIATTMALDNSDGSGLITANQCTIVGPVSSGVVVNN
jgi:pectin methylesterase-like acyl-CoA thioesterase